MPMAEARAASRKGSSALRSMTGFGRGRAGARGLRVDAEIRSVNHRWFKFKVAAPAELAGLESALEERVRTAVRRGTVQLSLQVESKAAAEAPRLNVDVLRSYQRQLREAQRSLKLAGDVPLGLLLSLPQVWSADGTDRPETDALGRLARAATDEAIRDLVAARAREGRGIQRACLGHLDRMEASLADIRARAPAVVRDYQTKLRERVQTLLQGAGASLKEDDLAREVAVFADRCDIAEELQRLQSHLAETRRLFTAGGEVGKRLEFLSQEILRESNTIGVKSNDYAIAAATVGLKAVLEKVKEQIENIE